MSGLLAYNEDFVSLTGTGKPERINAALTSADYFTVLGLQPILGRGLLPVEEEKPGTTPSVVISYALWQSHFGGDRSIVGKTIEINKSLCTVVGVAPPGFQGCSTGSRVDLWASLVYRGEEVRQRGRYWLNVFGRLKPGVSRRQAEEELNLQMQRIVAQFPDSHRGPNQITLDPLWRSPIGVNVYLYKSLPILLALAAVLLLLACANAAPTTIVSNCSVERASAPRAAVVKISEALNRIGNRAKNRRPRQAIPGQSRHAGQFPRCRTVTGSNSKKPMPNRKEPIASGSIAPAR